MEEAMKLSYFTNDLSFPFYIQYGRHKSDMYIHTHEDYTELVIVLNGTAKHIVNNEENIIKKGDVFVITPSTSHGYKNTSGFHICNIMFKYDYFFKDCEDICNSNGFNSLFVYEPIITHNYKFTNHLSLNEKNYDVIYKMITTIHDEYYSKNDAKNAYVHSLFLQMAVFLSRTYTSEVTTMTDDNMKNVLGIAATADFIDHHYGESISLSRLAELSGFSERHFSRKFYDIFGVNAMDYLKTARLKHAIFLLDTTEMDIGSIATECGFVDSSYFSRFFKQEYNVSPTNYRKINPLQNNAN